MHSRVWLVAVVFSSALIACAAGLWSGSGNAAMRSGTRMRPVPTVSVDQFQDPGVEFQTFYRTAQGYQEFLIKLLEGQKIGAGLHAHLVEAA